MVLIFSPGTPASFNVLMQPSSKAPVTSVFHSAHTIPNLNSGACSNSSGLNVESFFSAVARVKLYAQMSEMEIKWDHFYNLGTQQRT